VEMGLCSAMSGSLSLNVTMTDLKDTGHSLTEERPTGNMDVLLNFL
jgi:hypothetical protein